MTEVARVSSEHKKKNSGLKPPDKSLEHVQSLLNKQLHAFYRPGIEPHRLGLAWEVQRTWRRSF